MSVSIVTNYRWMSPSQKTTYASSSTGQGAVVTTTMYKKRLSIVSGTATSTFAPTQNTGTTSTSSGTYYNPTQKVTTVNIERAGCIPVRSGGSINRTTPLPGTTTTNSSLTHKFSSNQVYYPGSTSSSDCLPCGILFSKR